MKVSLGVIYIKINDDDELAAPLEISADKSGMFYARYGESEYSADQMSSLIGKVLSAARVEEQNWKKYISIEVDYNDNPQKDMEREVVSGLRRVIVIEAAIDNNGDVWINRQCPNRSYYAVEDLVEFRQDLYDTIVNEIDGLNAYIDAANKKIIGMLK